MNLIRPIANIELHDWADSGSSIQLSDRDRMQGTAPSVLQSYPSRYSALKGNNMAAKGLRYSGTDLLLERHCSKRRSAKPSVVSPPPDAGADWEVISILGFAVFSFAALAFAVYMIWNKARGTAPF